MQSILLISGDGGIKTLAEGEAGKPLGLAEGLRAGSRVVVINLVRGTAGAAVPVSVSLRLHRKTVRTK